MTQTELTKRPIAQVGEAITHELGAQMIKDFQLANPTEIKYFQIGRNIIEQVLAQPGCAGIQFYNAYNEEGMRTLVYVGLDETGKAIAEYTVVDNQGSIGKEKGIVADKVRPPGDNDTMDWVWLVD